MTSINLTFCIIIYNIGVVIVIIRCIVQVQRACTGQLFPRWSHDERQAVTREGMRKPPGQVQTRLTVVEAAKTAEARDHGTS